MKYLILISALFLSSCATNPQRALNHLRPPLDTLPGPVKLRQQLSIKSEKLNQSFEAVLSYDEKVLKVVALTTMGSILFSMEYDGKQLKSSNPKMQKLAQLVLSDILLATMKPEDLSKQLPEALEVLDKDQLRSVLNRGDELVKVSYIEKKAWPREFVLVRISQGYELKVRTLEEL